VTSPTQRSLPYNT